MPAVHPLLNRSHMLPISQWSGSDLAALYRPWQYFSVGPLDILSYLPIVNIVRLVQHVLWIYFVYTKYRFMARKIAVGWDASRSRFLWSAFTAYIQEI